MRVNSSPEAFMIKDKDYSIVSCSPETLINKRAQIFYKTYCWDLKKFNG